MRHANPTRARFAFKRDRLPTPADYYRAQGLKLIGGGEWKSAVCPFHDDTRPRALYTYTHPDGGAWY